MNRKRDEKRTVKRRREEGLIPNIFLPAILDQILI
jgi:hypothetical protein